MRFMALILSICSKLPIPLINEKACPSKKPVYQHGPAFVHSYFLLWCAAFWQKALSLNINTNRQTVDSLSSSVGWGAKFLLQRKSKREVLSLSSTLSFRVPLLTVLHKMNRKKYSLSQTKCWCLAFLLVSSSYWSGGQGKKRIQIGPYKCSLRDQF